MRYAVLLFAIASLPCDRYLAAQFIWRTAASLGSPTTILACAAAFTCYITAHHPVSMTLFSCDSISFVPYGVPFSGKPSHHDLPSTTSTILLRLCLLPTPLHYRTLPPVVPYGNIFLVYNVFCTNTNLGLRSNIHLPVMPAVDVRW